MYIPYTKNCYGNKNIYERKMVGHIAYIGDIRTAEGNSPFGRPGYG
jgi:hypothetical protein